MTENYIELFGSTYDIYSPRQGFLSLVKLEESEGEICGLCAITGLEDDPYLLAINIYYNSEPCSVLTTSFDRNGKISLKRFEMDYDSGEYKLPKEFKYVDFQNLIHVYDFLLVSDDSRIPSNFKNDLKKFQSLQKEGDLERKLNS